jgi:hypothetical protein
MNIPTSIARKIASGVAQKSWQLLSITTFGVMYLAFWLLRLLVIILAGAVVLSLSRPTHYGLRYNSKRRIFSRVWARYTIKRAPSAPSMTR